MTVTLHIGNKNYSSWSLRPWLVLRWAGVPFDENLVRLGGEGYGAAAIPEILAISPSGRVPALETDDGVIWDSLAISEWAAEQVPSLWPADRAVRAQARAVTCEMHSGFAGIRRDMSMNLRRRVNVPSWPADTEKELTRFYALVTEARAAHGAQGPWLFGERSIADAFLLPVATRFRSYEVVPPDPVAEWCATVLADADFLAWEADALQETWRIESTEKLYRSML